MTFDELTADDFIKIAASMPAKWTMSTLQKHSQKIAIEFGIAENDARAAFLTAYSLQPNAENFLRTRERRSDELKLIK